MIFWTTWTRAERWALLFAAVGLLFSLAFLAYGATRELEDLAPWLTLQSGQAVNVPLYEFSEHLHQMVIEAPYYVIYDYRVPGPIGVDTMASYILVSLVFFGFSLVLGALPSIQKTYVYYGSLGVVLYALSKCKWELLGLFGQEDKTFLLLVLAAYGLSNFAFYAFLTRVKLLVRVGVYLALSGALLFVVATQSTVADGLLELAAHSLNLPVFALVLLSILTAPEVPFALLRLMGSIRSVKGRGPLLPYLLFVLAYLGNVILAFLYANESIEGPTAAIGAFILLPLCTLVGIWGWKNKEEIYKGGLTFQGGGALIYFGLAIMGLSLVGWSLFQVNDSLLEAETDIVLMLQIGLSAAVLPYVWINFRRPFMEGQPVGRIMYKPIRLPLLGVYLFGVVAAVILFLQSNQVAYKQWQAGTEIAAGDAYHAEGNELLATAAYQEACLIDQKGFRANYTLGDVAYREESFSEAAFRFENSLRRHASPQAYVIWARAQHQLEALALESEILNEGLARFPGSAELNLYYAQFLAESGEPDSARTYYQSALEVDPESALGATGLLALAAQYGPKADLDSVYPASRYEESASYQANWLVNAGLQQREDLPEVRYDLLADSLLDNSTYFYLRNVTLARLGRTDQRLADTLDHYAYVPSNFLFQWGLNYVLALHHYADHRLDRAVPLLEKQAELVAPQYYPWFNQQVGRLLWQAGAYSKAEEFLERSLRSQSFVTLNEADIDHAFFLSGKENHGRAVGYWQQLAGRDSARAELADQVIGLLTNSNPNGLSGDDLARWQSFQPTQQDSSRTANPYRREALAPFRKAKEKAASNDTTGIGALFAKAIAANPYDEQVVLEVADYYESKGQQRRAYDILLEANIANPRSAAIGFAYAMQCVHLSLDNFADDAMETLKTARGMTPELYRRRQAELEAARKAREAAIEEKLKAQGF